MIRVAICDDSAYITSEVEKLLDEYNPALFDSYVYHNSSRLMSQINQTDFDLYILDIEMPGYSGIELAQEIRKHNINVPIVFLTSYKEYMEEVFIMQTFDYLIKPIDKHRFFSLLERIIKYLAVSTNTFTFVENKVTIQLKTNDIIYFEKNRRQVIIQTESRTYSPYMSTQDVMSKLNHQFVQIHTSFIMNTNYIHEIRKSSIVLRNKKRELFELPISRKFKEQALEKILFEVRGKMT